jgi:hypothetical protein
VTSIRYTKKVRDMPVANMTLAHYCRIVKKLMDVGICTSFEANYSTLNSNLYPTSCGCYFLIFLRNIYAFQSPCFTKACFLGIFTSNGIMNFDSHCRTSRPSISICGTNGTTPPKEELLPLVPLLISSFLIGLSRLNPPKLCALR